MGVVGRVCSPMLLGHEGQILDVEGIIEPLNPPCRPGPVAVVKGSRAFQVCSEEGRQAIGVTQCNNALQGLGAFVLTEHHTKIFGSDVVHGQEPNLRSMPLNPRIRNDLDFGVAPESVLIGPVEPLDVIHA